MDHKQSQAFVTLIKEEIKANGFSVKGRTDLQYWQMQHLLFSFFHSVSLYSIFDHNKATSPSMGDFSMIFFIIYSFSISRTIGLILKIKYPLRLHQFFLKFHEAHKYQKGYLVLNIDVQTLCVCVYVWAEE